MIIGTDCGETGRVGGVRGEGTATVNRPPVGEVEPKTVAVEMVIRVWLGLRSEMASGCELMEVQRRWEAGLTLICMADIEMWNLRRPPGGGGAEGQRNEAQVLGRGRNLT